MSSDDATKATNDDASSCKKSAVVRNYWTDPYLKCFIRSNDRKAPEIHRGYYARVKGVEILLHQFLEVTKCECQVVNLGSGFDTTYWRLHDANLKPKNFIEVDFPDVISRKAFTIKSRKELFEKLQSEGEVSITKNGVHSARYHAVGADLRNLDQLSARLGECGFDSGTPTVFLAECVLVYMPADCSTALLRWIADNVTTAVFINYEQVNMNDRFGEVMLENLAQRGCSLAGVAHCESLDSQEKRFVCCGWDAAQAWDMNMVYHNLPQADVQRIEKLEFLDELESLTQLFHHYCMSVSFKDSKKALDFSSISILPT